MEANGTENTISENTVIEKPTWGVCLFANLYATTTDVVFNDWSTLKAKIHTPAVSNVNHADFTAWKSTSDKKLSSEHKKIKGKNGLIMGGLNATVTMDNGKTTYSCAAVAPKIKQFSILAMDYDDGIPSDFVHRFKTALAGLQYTAYTTVSSTEETPRWRIIVPLEVPVDTEVRNAVMRAIVDLIGWAGFDDSGLRPTQRMALPVQLAGETVHYVDGEGDMLNAVQWLDAHVANWNVPADLPKSPKESEEIHVAKNSNKSVLTPKEWSKSDTKNGLINAFLKAYSCDSILERSNLYHIERANDAEHRWSRNGDNGGGIVVYPKNDTCKCWYASDKLGGLKAQNSFGLYYHLFHEGKAIKEVLKELKKDQAVLDALRGDIQLPEEMEILNARYDETEEGVAQRCMEYYPHLRCNGAWWRYQGGIYKESTPSAMIPDVMEMIRFCYASMPDNEAFGMYRGTHKYAKAILAIWEGLAEKRAVTLDVFETHKNLLHFTDGVLDLEKYANGDADCLLPHDPKYLMTESTGYAYADIINAPQDAVDEVAHNIAVYLPDTSVRSYFWRAIGRCLSMESVAEDICVWLLGTEGGNGKSTLLRAIKGALGSYYYSLKAEILYKKRDDNNGEAPSPALAGMANKRFVNFEEFDYLRTLNTTKYKDYTSAGFIQARKMRVNDNSFMAKCVCAIDTNGMPGVDKMEGAIMRRTRVIPFKQVLSGDARIRDKWESNKDIHHAMMLQLLAGFTNWWRNGKKLDEGREHPELWPVDVKEETFNWFNAFDNPVIFFEEYLDITHNEDDYIVFNDVWQTYCEQLVGKGSSAHQLRMELARWLKKQGLTEKRRKPVGDARPYCTIGVALKNAFTTTSVKVMKREPYKGSMCTTGENYGYRQELYENRGYL